MGYTLRAGVTFCIVGDRLVFLDADQDRYFCLARPVEGAFARLVAGAELSAADEAAFGALLADGVLIPAANGVAPTPCPAPAEPVSSLLDTMLPAARPGALLAALRQRAVVAADLRWRGFAGTLAHTRRGKPAGTPADAALLATLGASNRVAATLGAHDRCLPGSLALARQLFALGQPVDVVIGVNLQPFKAHCWVQAGTTLVNERLEIARVFTPILVL